METVYVGLDLGSSNFHQVAVNDAGASRINREFTTSEANLIKAFSDQRGEIHVHLEAGELAPWAASIIRPWVTRVVCSHPQTNAWIAKDADKCDRVDAYKLAELLRLNRFKEVHYPQEQRRREFKTLVQHYDELTQQQARLKTKLKARLRMQGVIVRGERLFSAAGGASFSGDPHLSHSAGHWSDRGLSLQCLHSYAEPLQHDPQALEVLPAECQSSQQQRQASAAAATRSLRLWPFEGCIAQSFRRCPARAPRQWLQASLSAGARDHARCDACAVDGAAQDRLDPARDVAIHDALW